MKTLYLCCIFLLGLHCLSIAQDIAIYKGDALHQIPNVIIQKNGSSTNQDLLIITAAGIGVKSDGDRIVLICSTCSVVKCTIDQKGIRNTGFNKLTEVHKYSIGISPWDSVLFDGRILKAQSLLKMIPDVIGVDQQKPQQPSKGGG